MRRVKKFTTFAAVDTFPNRHIGPQEADIKQMLQVVNATSLDDLSSKVVPVHIQRKEPLWTDEPKGEVDALEELRDLAQQNKVLKSFIGLGYYGTKTPHVILRNLIESPGWYTAYTPYQAEISQGRLESLINFQTMVRDLTAMDLANASLLDEGTAAGEVVGIMLSHHKGKKKSIFIDQRCHPQTIAVARTRASGFHVELVVGDFKTFDFSKNPDVGAVIVQYPDTNGTAEDFTAFFGTAKKAGAICAVATDLLALCSLKPPGEFGADIALGSAQRFGVPMGFGGPHAAFLACKDAFKRIIPGRIIGVSKDADGQQAFRMALQTREQHIKREKATSNICTAQALLANTAAMYAVYHGPEGLSRIAADVHLKAKTVAAGLRAAGHTVTAGSFFDTVHVTLNGLTAEQYRAACVSRGINIRVVDAKSVGIALDETATEADVVALIEAAGGKGESLRQYFEAAAADVLGPLKRTSKFLQHAVFNSFHCEMEMQRYLYRLEKKDLSLNTAMIPLGSCTMKLNAATEMMPLSWKEYGAMHPFAPLDQAAGYIKLIQKLESRLEAVTGFDRISLQPNSGAQGEYAGLRVIRAYHESRGQGHRKICLIPTSAHGTNPATAALCDLSIVPVVCDSRGNVDVADLKAKAEKHKDNLAALMITYPSTHGVFEETIDEICRIIHANGGQVYLDGANMNAQVGLCRPGDYGADVCHLNLHKTFAIPHGGGGPGQGPIGVKAHLAPFLPNSAVVSHPALGGAQSLGSISAAPWGSASILTISYAYIEMMGAKGLKEATQVAILAANYLAKILSKEFSILYTGKSGFSAHEFILDARPFKKTAGIEAEDIAKRLMDYGIHAPTLSFPVAGTLMIEPTESESKFELDRLAEALLLIREEIREVEQGKQPRDDNVLKNAPHTHMCLTGEWKHPYTREKAVYPTQFVKQNKYWPTVRRIDNAYGDRNLMCTCPPMEAYEIPLPRS